MSLQTVIFPDGEMELVKAINAAFTTHAQPITTNVLVSVRKASPQVSPQPTKQVIIRSDGGTVLHNGTHKNERFGINVWAATFEEASQLANVLEAILKTLSTDTIKKVEISLSPTRVDYEGDEEQRYITCSALISSDNFTL